MNTDPRVRQATPEEEQRLLANLKARPSVEALLSIDDIAAKFRASRRTVAERWIHAPEFPAPKYAPTRQTRLWAAKDVETWAARSVPRSARQSPGSTCSEGS
jgi:hypothetical protein